MPQAMVDGRRLRRMRGRDAVIDAMLDLLLETGRVAPVREVAVRADVSESSVYRYFENLDGLHTELVGRTLERFGHLFELPGLGEGSLEERITALIEARAELYAETGPISRLIRELASRRPVFAAPLEEGRKRLHIQVEEHFAPELAALSEHEATDIALAITTATSYESWDLHGVLGHGPDEIRRAWAVALRRLLSS